MLKLVDEQCIYSASSGQWGLESSLITRRQLEIHSASRLKHFLLIKGCGGRWGHAKINPQRVIESPNSRPADLEVNFQTPGQRGG